MKHAIRLIVIAFLVVGCEKEKQPTPCEVAKNERSIVEDIFHNSAMGSSVRPEIKRQLYEVLDGNVKSECK